MHTENELNTKVNEALLEEKAFAYKLNLKKNKSLIDINGGLASIIPAFKKKNVIIVGASPSIDEYIPELLKIQKRQDILIVAVDMSFRILSKNKIHPKFVMTCETHPRDFFSGLDTKNNHLLAFSCSSHSNLRQWKGQISFYNWMKRGEFYEKLWKQSGEDLGFVGTASIVTSQALALVLGCSPSKVLLLGNDLAFNDVYYSRFSERTERLHSKSNRFNTVNSIEKKVIRRAAMYQLSRGEKSYYTSPQFLTAKKWMEKVAIENSVDIFDGSIPGVAPEAVIKIIPGDLDKLFSLKRRKRKKR